MEEIFSTGESIKLAFIYLGAFAVISVASFRFGKLFTKIKLPQITGLLITGMIAGPYILKMIPKDAVDNLNFISEASLAFIAFAAGAELYVKELRSRFRSITFNTIAQTVATFSVTALSIYFFADHISFMDGLSKEVKISIAILAGTIFVARSPSSAIAIINEMRAKGPFTQTILGVTVVTDVLVVTLFAICFSISESLIMGEEMGIGFLLILALELAVSFGIGFLLGKILGGVMKLRVQSMVKTALVLILGYSIYLLYHYVREVSVELIDHEVLLEPLLICIIGSFVVTNYSSYRAEFISIVENVAPIIYVVFFTYVGLSISLNILMGVLATAFVWFAIRLFGLMTGSVIGGMLTRDPWKYNRIGWMPYVTQAGVALGLATIISKEFPEWGPQFATAVIGLIVVNQILGPPLFKWAINLVGEAHQKATFGEENDRDAIIFGLESQSLALARQLQEHGWSVKIATRGKNYEKNEYKDLDIQLFNEIDLETLTKLEAQHATAVVTLLTDDENYQICELAYENFGNKDLVVRLNDRANFDRFHGLNALIVEPSTAIVSLLDHYVRSPLATSLLLGLEQNQDTVDLEVLNPNLHGIALRDLRFPSDIIILSVRRGGQMIISHGYTRLRLGDILTVVGSRESLENVSLRFEAPGGILR